MKKVISFILLSMFFLGCETRDVNSLSKDYFEAWIKGDFETINSLSSKHKKAYYIEWFDVCVQAKKIGGFKSWIDDLTDARLQEKHNNIILYKAKVKKAELSLKKMNEQRSQTNQVIKNNTVYPYISLSEQSRIYDESFLELDKNKFKNMHLFISIRGNEKEYFSQNIKSATQDMLQMQCTNDLLPKKEVSNVVFHLGKAVDMDKYRVLIDFTSQKKMEQFEIIFINENGDWMVDSSSVI